MERLTTPQANSATAAGIPAKRYRGVLAVVVFMLGLASSAFGEANVAKPAGETGMSLDTIVAALQSNGFQAKLLDNPPPAILGQILTGIAGANVVIQVFKCDGVAATAICALNFVTAFRDVPELPASTMASLNSATFAKAGALTAKDGTTSGLAVTYLYPCQGLDNASVVPMVLRNFGSGVAAVLSTYQKLAVSAAPSPSRRPLDLSGKAPTSARLESAPVRPTLRLAIVNSGRTASPA
jgi:hypothetical protein